MKGGPQLPEGPLEKTLHPHPKLPSAATAEIYKKFPSLFSKSVMDPLIALCGLQITEGPMSSTEL